MRSLIAILALTTLLAAACTADEPVTIDSGDTPAATTGQPNVDVSTNLEVVSRDVAEARTLLHHIAVCEDVGCGEALAPQASSEETGEPWLSFEAVPETIVTAPDDGVQPRSIDERDPPNLATPGPIAVKANATRPSRPPVQTHSSTR